MKKTEFIKNLTLPSALFSAHLVLALLPMGVWGGINPFAILEPPNPYSEMSEEFSANAEERGVRRVAVLEFKRGKQKSPEGRVVQDRLISSLNEKGIVFVVERDRLDELKLEGLKRKRLGKILGVDGLIFGTLLDIGEGRWEVHARLVLVETGEVIGAMTKQLDPSWLEPMRNESGHADPFDTWNSPQGLLSSPFPEGIVPGTVLFKNARSTESEPRINEVTLVKEEIDSATFDVSYTLPLEFQGRFLNINSSPLRVGAHCVRIQNSSVFMEGLFFKVTLWESVKVGSKIEPRIYFEEFIPFRKTYVDPFYFWPDRVIKPSPTIKIFRVDPPLLSWDKQFIIFGEFNGVRHWHFGSSVVLGNQRSKIILNVLDCQPDRIVVSSPKSGKPNERFDGIQTDKPYYLFVVSMEEHSNLAFVKFKSENPPKN